MIYDDQPGMVEATAAKSAIREALAQRVLRDAFAAIDREALIEKGTNALLSPEDKTEPGFLLAREQSERVLVAAGIIPEES